ncbi:hypothetical protein ABO04_08290 [Nitrosomonas sp. HPC101]|nr:hypothetical protein [Nitrosomonas sp. HPC101]
MTQSHHRHDISDKVWALLERYLPGREGVCTERLPFGSIKNSRIFARNQGVTLSFPVNPGQKNVRFNSPNQ